jgi:4-hydroxy-3-methylbut-2-enyl diphosphate reductase
MAIKAGEDETGELYTLGDIIHNPQVVSDLESKGIQRIDSLDELDSGTCVIRTHGIPPSLENEIKSRGLKILDATCPVVRKSQELVVGLVNDDYQVVIVGKAHHPEVIGLLGYAGDQGRVISHPDELVGLRIRRVGVVAQTTISRDLFSQVLYGLLNVADELKVHVTICRTTIQRQESALNLAKMVDFMLVVGGRNSSNTVHLYKMLEKNGPPVEHIETPEEIDPAWFGGNVLKVGITAGASTPNWVIEGVADKLNQLAGFTTVNVE